METKPQTLRQALADRSQAWLAQKVRVSRGAVCLWIKGARVPPPQQARKIGEALGLEVDAVALMRGQLRFRKSKASA
jgi:DNA-binding XRE family transcriptional regulator